MQLVFADELDLDPPALAFADDAGACAEGQLQLFLGGADVYVDGRLGLLLLWRRGFLDERLGFAHREITADDIPRDAQLRGFVG
jgi:hypothetical protein